MIAVDTSALMAIILGEPIADACIRVLEAETEVLISVGNRGGSSHCCRSTERRQ